MTINIKLLRNEPCTKFGYPLVIICSQNGKRPKKTFAHAEGNHFNDAMQMITNDHPDYDLLAPKIMDYKLKARKIILDGETDPDKARIGIG